MRSAIRAGIGATVVAVVAALAAVLPLEAAHAAVEYTWVAGWDGDGDTIPEADHKSWENAANWSPAGIPGPDDAVVLTNAPASHGNVQPSTELYVPADGRTVASLTIEKPGVGSVRLIDGAVEVTGSFEWTGGEVRSAVTVGPDASGRVGAGALKPLMAEMTVAGSLRLDNLGTDPDTELQMYSDPGGDDDGITVTPTGTLSAAGANLVWSDCCTDPARIRNHGTVEVTTGRLVVQGAELDQSGVVQVAPGARLVQTTGPARLGDGASYRGGGTVEFIDTAKVAAHPESDPAPGGVLMEGVGTVSAQTRIHFGVGAKLTGVGGFTGKGVVDVSAAPNPGQDGAHVYGDLSIGAGTTLALGGAVPSRLEVWAPGLRGYHGVLRIKGEAALARGRTFVTQGGTTTTVAGSGRLRLQPRTTWGTGDCCVRPARLDNRGTVVVAGGAGASPKLVRVDLRNNGVLSLAAGKRLATEGYPIRVGGTLKVTGKSKPGKQRTVVTADKVKGSFACVRPAGQVAISRAGAVKVTGLLGKSKACVRGAGKKLVSKVVKGHKTLKVRATKGVKASAKKVVVAVTVSKVARPARIKVGGAPAFRAGKGTTTRYVVAKRVGKKFVTVKNAGSKPVKVTVVLLGAA